MSDRPQDFAGEQDDPDALEALMDRALLSYTPAHPRLGLEDRVRARLDSAAASRERVPMLWVWAAATALVAILLAALTLRPHARPEPANLDAARESTAIPTIQIPGRRPAIALAHPPNRLSASHTQSPQLTPREPSQRELIDRLLANGSEAVASLARNDDKLDKPINIQPLPDDPLVIEPIMITPIDDNPAEPSGNF